MDDYLPDLARERAWNLFIADMTGCSLDGDEDDDGSHHSSKRDIPEVKPKVIYVPASRLAFGSEDKKKQGDVSKSYSADLIAMKGTVSIPFLLDGGMYVNVGSAINQGDGAIMAYRLAPEDEYQGSAWAYREHPYYGYEGMKVTWRKRLYVLTGRITVLPEPDNGPLFAEASRL